MKKLVIEIELSDEQIEAVNQEVMIQNAWEKAHGLNGNWTAEKELRIGILEHIEKLQKPSRKIYVEGGKLDV